MPEEPLTTAEVTYFMRRLAETRRVAGLPASIAFDLARSPLSDDDLETATETFGAKRGEGWGLSSLLEDMLSRTPDAVPIKDLQTLQENLKKEGYADPNMEATGIWDPSWYGAFRRRERDAQEAIRTGHDWKSGPIVAGVEMLSNTLPSRVWQGLVGTAKGMIQQAPETATRVGLIGGMGAGAAIGATIGGPVGAGVGAVAGSVVGFFGDLLTEDEGEDPGIGIDDFVDALSPWTEYKTNPKAFWEDLGFVGSAAAMVGGAKLAVQGARAGMQAIRTAQAAPVMTPEAAMVPAALPGGFSAPAFATGNVTAQAASVPSRSLMQAALARPVGTPEIGVFSKLLKAALKKPFPGTAAAFEKTIQKYGLMAQMSRPAFRLMSKTYTGAVAAQLGSRFAAGFTGPRFDQWQGTTTIEKAIAETKPLETVNVPLLGDLVDVTAFFVWPERFFPWKKGAISEAFTRLGHVDGKYARLNPFVHVHIQNEARKGRFMSWREGWEEVSGRVGVAQELRIRAEFGIQKEAEDLAHKIALPQTAEQYGDNVAAAAFDLKRSIRSEMEAGEGASETLERVVKHSLDHEGEFAAYLSDLEGRGRGLDFVTGWDEAERLALKYERLMDKGALVDVNHVIMTRSNMPEGVSPTLLKMRGEGVKAFERQSLVTQIQEIQSRVKTYSSKAERMRDPSMRMDYFQRARTLKEDVLPKLKKQLAALNKGGTIMRDAESMRIVPARLQTPTRADYYLYRDEYMRLRERVRASWKADPEGRAYVEAQQDFNDFVLGLEDQGIFTEEMAGKLLRPNPSAEPGKYLARRAKHAARDVQLPQDQLEELAALGYKPVLTGEDVLFNTDFAKVAEIYGPAEYSRRQNLIESLGFSPRWRENIDTYQYRVEAEQAEFRSWATATGIDISEKRLQKILHNAVERVNHSGSTWGPMVKPVGKGPRMFLTDLRDLHVEDIMDIPELVKLGVDDEKALKLFHAIRRGAALGGEASLRHPAQSLRMMGRAMRVNGLPGFSDTIRTLHTKDPAGWSFVKLGAASGAALAMEEDIRQGKSLTEVVADAVKGAALGGAAGMVLGPGLGKGPLRGLAKRNYGYLPDILVRANTALRFSLSLTFDAGRYMEQNTIAYAKYGLPFMWSPRKYIRRYAREQGLKGFGGVIANEDDAWRATAAFWDELNGTHYFKVLDDIDRRMYQKGVLSFSPRDWEAAQAMMLYQRGMSKDAIRDAVSHIGRYGPGRTAAEKSMNFIFFPFSFSKKLLMTMGDFMLQAPARALLVHEGFRRFSESTIDDRVGDFLDRHLPLLKDLWQINNLSFGLSPGRFFLEGLSDDRTNVGKVMQALTHVFVPSGAATPLGQMAGGVGDLAVQAFTPIVVTGESISRIGNVNNLYDVVSRYIPFVREMKQYFVGSQSGLVEQWTAMTQRLAPYPQYQDYIDQLREYKDSLEPMALALGYSSVDGFLNSDMGVPAKLQLEDFRAELMKKYPTGAAMSQQFENSVLTNDRAIRDLVEKVNRSEGEDAIVRIAEEIEKGRMLTLVGGVPSELVAPMTTMRIRRFSKRYANDRRFQELYRQLFEPVYGPIIMTEV